MLAYTSDSFVLPLPNGHRFPMEKYRLLREAVEAELAGVRLMQAPVASAGELALAHAPDYIDAVMRGTLSAAAQREIGFPWSERMVERSCRSVGATVAAARSALGEGVALNLAGGTHHAYPDHGSGYCVFNDVAVAARLMQAEWHRTHSASMQVLVIDLDVHQGNGTAAIFQHDASVFTLSLHGAQNFPFRKACSDLDVPLPDGCGDDAYLAALHGALAETEQRLTKRWPQLAFYLAGADPHQDDRLGRLALSDDGLARRDRCVFDWLQARGVPVAVSMAGGYGRDVQHTVRLQVNTVRLAAESWRAWATMRQPNSVQPPA